MRAFTYLLAGTYHGGDQISRIELPPDPAGRRLDSVVNTTVYLHKEDVPAIVPMDYGGRDEIRQIRERGVLRVGYNSNNVPFVFFNGRDELVGYDVEMAYDLARSLNVSRIEFVPITGTTLAESLDSGYCDIIMSAVMVNEERLDADEIHRPGRYRPPGVRCTGRKKGGVHEAGYREEDGRPESCCL